MNIKNGQANAQAIVTILDIDTLLVTLIDNGPKKWPFLVHILGRGWPFLVHILGHPVQRMAIFGTHFRTPCQLPF